MRLRPTHLIAVVFAAGMATATAAGADTLQMPQGDGAPQQVYSQELPAKGLTMKQVESRFGAPEKKIPAVGEPPITRWVYPSFTVYFERQYVIHSVLHRK